MPDISIDSHVLEHLRSIHGSTAWAMRHAIGEDRETISKALQRLKRKGLVECTGTAYWQATTEAAVTRTKFQCAARGCDGCTVCKEDDRA